MAVTTVYASGASGYVYCSNATYLTAARGDGTFSVTSPDNISQLGQRLFLGSYIVYQVYLKWDTSAVGSDTVTNVDLEVDGAAATLAATPVLEGYAYDWGTTLESADFRDSDAGIPALGSIISSYDTAGGWSDTSGYNNDLGALSAFNSAINGSGDTRIVLLSSRHRTETAPSGGEYVQLEVTGATNDARLTITHSAAGTTASAGVAAATAAAAAPSPLLGVAASTAAATAAAAAPSPLLAASAGVAAATAAALAATVATQTWAYLAPDADITTTGWAEVPLWSKVDDDPASPDAVVIVGTAA